MRVRHNLQLYSPLLGREDRVQFRNKAQNHLRLERTVKESPELSRPIRLLPLLVLGPMARRKLPRVVPNLQPGAAITRQPGRQSLIWVRIQTILKVRKRRKYQFLLLDHLNYQPLLFLHHTYQLLLFRRLTYQLLLFHHLYS